MLGYEFETAQEAAVHAIAAINPRSVAENIEYAGKVRMNPATGLYYATPPVAGTDTRAALTFNKQNDRLTVGDYHTHGSYFGYDDEGNPVIGNRLYDTLSGTDSENFSTADRLGASVIAAFLGKPDYLLWLGTPGGAVKQYSTDTGETITIRPGQ